MNMNAKDIFPETGTISTMFLKLSRDLSLCSANQLGILLIGLREIQFSWKTMPSQFQHDLMTDIARRWQQKTPSSTNSSSTSSQNKESVNVTKTSDALPVHAVFDAFHKLGLQWARELSPTLQEQYLETLAGSLGDMNANQLYQTIFA